MLGPSLGSTAQPSPSTWPDLGPLHLPALGIRAAVQAGGCWTEGGGAGGGVCVRGGGAVGEGEGVRLLQCPLPTLYLLWPAPPFSGLWAALTRLRLGFLSLYTPFLR